MSQITVSIELNRAQAEAYLRYVVCQFELAMADCWFSDQYRHTPEGLRGRRVLDDHPHIAALCRTARELKAQLAAAEVQA